MTLRNSHKLMLLFVSADNPGWQDLIGPSPKVAEIMNALGRSASRISQWRSGHDITVQSAGPIFENAISFARGVKGRAGARAASRFSKYRDAFGRGNVPLYGMAELLGMQPAEAQLAFDKIIYNGLPLFPKMYEPSRDRAEEVVRAYGGVYQCFVLRGRDLYRCALRVRYPLHIARGFPVRCKLNVPREDRWVDEGGPAFWEYDGFLSRREQKIFWTFEKRTDQRADYVSFITEAYPAEGTELFKGKYLTASQDVEPVIVAGDVFLERVRTANFDEIAKFMHESPVIFSDPDAKPEMDRLQGKKKT